MKKLHRSACLTNYVELAKTLNLSPMEQLRQVNISASCLSNPDSMVPFSAFSLLLENSAQASGQESFGLRMAEGRKLSNLGPLAVVLRSQPTLRDALDALRKYCHLQGEEIQFFFEEIDDVLIIHEELVPDHLEPMRQATEMSLGILHKTLRAMLGKEWQPKSVCFRHAAPKDMSHHQRVFGTRLYFNRTFNGIVCGASGLDDPLPDYDPETARYLMKLLGPVTTRSAASMSERVREILWILLPTGRFSATIVAQQIGLEGRSLYRQLKQDGQSFSEILDNVRSELAIKYLTESHRSVKELAELLGYSETSAFSRWFSKRFGCTASDWRENHKNAHPSHASADDFP